MNDILRKSFGGLSKSYYFRQLFFGVAISAILIFNMSSGQRSLDPMFLSLAVISTILYPYSRFVYESIVGFIMGDNVFFGNAIFMMAIKFFTMTLCWAFAIFIAPLGLLFLYFYHSRATS